MPVISSNYRSRFSRSNASRKRGFTLVELLVSIIIFVFINAIILVRHNQFNAQILLTNVAYEVGLAVREAQVYGLGVRDSGGGNFSSSYGVHFDGGVGTTISSFQLFRDIPDSVRDCNPNVSTSVSCYEPSELLEQKQMNGGYTISDFCLVQGGTTLCKSGGAQFVDIVFTRPNPDAAIRSDTSFAWTSVVITVASRQDTTRQVTVTNTGQITVQ